MIFPITQPHSHHRASSTATSFPTAWLRMKNEMNVREQVVEMFKKIGIGLPNVEPAFRYHFPVNNTSASRWNSIRSQQNSGGWKQDIEPIDPLRYYANESARIVMTKYRMDYISFNISVPHWAVLLVGEDYIRQRLHLKMGSPLPHTSTHNSAKHHHHHQQQQHGNFGEEDEEEVKTFDAYVDRHRPADKAFLSTLQDRKKHATQTEIKEDNGGDDDDDDNNGLRGAAANKIVMSKPPYASSDSSESFTYKTRTTTTNTATSNLRKVIGPGKTKQAKMLAVASSQEKRNGKKVTLSRDEKLQQAINYRCHLAMLHDRTPEAVRNKRCARAVFPGPVEEDLSHY
jgi:hypothetical protein